MKPLFVGGPEDGHRLPVPEHGPQVILIPMVLSAYGATKENLVIKKAVYYKKKSSNGTITYEFGGTQNG